MKLKKALRGYYREQVEAVKLSGGYAMPVSGGIRTGSLAFNVAFHAVLVALIAGAMISGRYQPSHLGEMIFQITERYNIDDRMVNSIENLIQLIKNSKRAGGAL